MKTAKAGSFFYPNLSYSASTNKLASKSTVQSSILSVSAKYSNTMNIVAEVAGDNQSLNNKLKAYVGTELRGEAIPIYNPLTSKTSYFVTIYGQSDIEKVRFEFVEDNGSNAVVNEVIAFGKDVVSGALATPTILTLKGVSDGAANIGSANTASVNELVNSRLLVSPNPFMNVLKIDFYAGHKVSKIVLTDMQGRILKSADITQLISTYTWDVQHISNGVYILSFYDADGNSIESQRVIKN
jgi:hypothetical protein